MRILVVMGTRPEVIKLVPVIVELKKQGIDTVVCATGQHREMLQQALDVFGVKPDIALDVMAAGQSLNELSSKLLNQLDKVLAEQKPDWVVVQGDTTTAFCVGWAAFQRNIKVAHVEAGLRTGDLQSPFPEEANRSLLARIATLHFAPTFTAARALVSEGIAPEHIYVTGNTVVDAIERVRSTWQDGCPSSLPVALVEWVRQPFVLVTCHRRENFGDVMESICALIARLCQRYPDYRWVFPVHLNPAVREPVYRLLGHLPNLLLTEPVDYHASLWLIEKARLVVSDSGGIQEEAPSFGTPVVVMRQHTERMEGVDAGFSTLAGQDPARIEEAVDTWLADAEGRSRLQERRNPYGDGQAGTRIAALLVGESLEPYHVK